MEIFRAKWRAANDVVADLYAKVEVPTVDVPDMNKLSLL